LLFRAWGTLRRTRHGKSLRGIGDLGKEIPGESTKWSRSGNFGSQRTPDGEGEN
jgi:hypothetical protein